MENINRFFIFLSLFFVIAVLISACANQAGTPAGTKETQQTTTTGKEAAPLGDAKGILTGLVSNKAPTYMVSYDVTGGNELTKLTMYLKSGKIRYDTVSHGNQSSLFMIDGKIYTCSFEPKMCVSFGQQNETPKTGTEDVEQQQNALSFQPARQLPRCAIQDREFRSTLNQQQTARHLK